MYEKRRQQHGTHLLKKKTAKKRVSHISRSINTRKNITRKCMFEIKLNKEIKLQLSKLNDDESAAIHRQEIERFLKNDSITMEALIKYHKECWQTEISLKQLLTPLEFKFKPKPVPGSNYTPEFKKQLDILDLQQQERDYQELIKKSRLTNLFGTTIGDDAVTPAQMSKEVREQVTTVFNVLVSVVSVVFAIWYWTGSSTRLALHYRVIICLFFGILVLVAEVVVYNSYLRKISDAKVKERSKKEKKKIVKKIII